MAGHVAPQRECELYQTQMGEDTVITEDTETAEYDREEESEG